MKRFEIIQVNGKYGIIDKLKYFTCIKNKRFTNKLFDTMEMSKGYIYGVRGKLSEKILK